MASSSSMTTHDYLDGEETNRKRELTYGVLREPPAPFFSHQQLVFRVARLLEDHVEPRGLGRVGLAPIDVVLDAERALVLQPDVLFVATERLSIIRDQVWGAPDLVVEVLSMSTESRDRDQKLGWYRQYGVREYWIVDLRNENVTVVDFTTGVPERHVCDRLGSIRSTILPEFHADVFKLFH
jgi:Uma2 family endonuclease